MNESRVRRVIVGLALGLVIAAAPAAAAQASWDAQLAVDPYPSPYLSDWETNPTISTLTVMNPTGQDRAVTLVYRVTEQAGQLLASGRSDAQTLPAGSTTYTSFVHLSGTSSHDAGLESQMRRTGRVPEGDYSVCVVASDAGGFVLAETCTQFTIVYPDPPLLVAPLANDALTAPQPLFQWTPLQVPVAYRVQYVLRVAEVMAHQTPDEALRANIPWYENYDVGGPNLQYPISARALEIGKTYAWRVQALDQYGYPPSANGGMSEVWTFRYTELGEPTLPAASVRLMVTNLRTTPGAPADTADAAKGLTDICQNFDSTTAGLSQFHFGVSSPVAFPANLNVMAVLHRYVTPDSQRVWALVGDVQRSTPWRVLVFGSCDDHAADWMPGAKWIGIRTVAGATSSEWLMTNSDSTADSASQAQADSASRVSGPGFEFGVVVFTLQEMAIAAPEGFTAVRDFLEGREFDAKPGINLLGVQQLKERAGWQFFQWLGYDQKEIEWYGYFGVNASFSFGFGYKQQAFVEPSAELEFFNLQAALPTREPPFVMRHLFKAMRLELALVIKDTVMNLGSIASKTGHQLHAVVALTHRLVLSDEVTRILRVEAGTELTSTLSLDWSYEFKPGSAEVKLSQKYVLDASWPLFGTDLVVGHPELELGVSLYGQSKDEITLTLTGAAGWKGVEESLGKLALTIGQKPKPRFLQMLDAMRDNITRWQDRRVFTMGELVMARTAADSAKLNGYITQYEDWIAKEQDQLTTFQGLNTTVELRKKTLTEQPHCLRAGWFCAFRLSLGNLSAVDMVALVRKIGAEVAQ